MEAPDIHKLLLEIKGPLDKARSVADSVDAAINGIDTNWLGKIVSHLPNIGTWVAAGVTAAAALRSLIDALDGVVDSYADPSAAPALPQATAT